MKGNNSQKGQALILIAFGIVALIGFTALAVDGGRVFSDRRHAQNAADTSVLAAALAHMRSEDYQSKGLERAESNGYINDADSTVVVQFCNESGVTCQGLPPAADPSQYIRVKITSDVPMTFARVLGRSLVTNTVEAIAKVVVPKTSSWFDGKAMVSTMPGCGGGGTPNPFTVGGNGTTIVNNSGIFVNSNCQPAFFDNGNSNLVSTDQGVCVVGGIQAGVNGVTPPPTGGCGTQVSINDFEQPDPSSYCATEGTIVDKGGYYEATPGYFNKTGNKTFPDVSPAGTLKMTKGVYCLYNGLSLNSNWTITSDVNDNNSHDSDSEGVLFYVPGGDVTFNGGSDMELHAINSGLPSSLLNYLFVIPLSNDADVTITGNNGSNFIGTIYAPASSCTINGSGNTFSLDAQVICSDNTITGGGTIDITFNAANNAVAKTKPTIELTK